MSGGSFEYAYAHFSYFAERVRNRLDEQGALNWYGDPKPAYAPAVAAKMREIADLAEHAGALAKEVEWLCSGDTGEDTFLARVAEIEKQKGG